MLYLCVCSRRPCLVVVNGSLDGNGGNEVLVVLRVSLSLWPSKLEDGPLLLQVPRSLLPWDLPRPQPLHSAEEPTLLYASLWGLHDHHVVLSVSTP
jgi:hypothetical protein